VCRLCGVNGVDIAACLVRAVYHMWMCGPSIYLHMCSRERVSAPSAVAGASGDATSCGICRLEYSTALSRAAGCSHAPRSSQAVGSVRNSPSLRGGIAELEPCVRALARFVPRQHPLSQPSAEHDGIQRNINS